MFLCCSSAKLRIISAILALFVRMTSLENHLCNDLIGREKSLMGDVNKDSTYCNMNNPQSEKLGCCGTFGQHPFIVSLSKSRSWFIFALYSHFKYSRNVAATRARLPVCRESKIKMQGLKLKLIFCKETVWKFGTFPANQILCEINF